MSLAAAAAFLQSTGLTFDQLVEFVANDIRGRRFGAITLTIAIYDHLLTLAEEVQFLRESPWSLTKVIFLMNRYFLLVLFAVTSLELYLPLPSDSLCLKALYFSIYGTIFIQGIASLSIAQRVYAFWDRSPRILLLLCLLWPAAVCSSIIVTILLFKDVTVTEKPGPFPPGCITMHKDFWASLIPAIAFDVAVVMLTVWRARALGMGTQTPIISHLLHTGLGYFLVMILANVVVAASFFSPMVLTVIIVPGNLTAVVSSMMCSRLLLYIRSELREYRQRPTDLSSISMPAMSEIERAEEEMEAAQLHAMEPEDEVSMGVAL